ncbi:unnamed protein product [Camellia sinensis]
MLYAPIVLLSFMRVKPIRQNFGTFLPFMLGLIILLDMFKVSSPESKDSYAETVLCLGIFNGFHTFFLEQE